MSQKQRGILGNVSSWAVFGISLILITVVLTLAWMNYNREKQYMGRVLSEKGAALIKSFEAGARTGMMGMLGTGPNMQTLLRETASLPDILYIAIVAPSGVILAHNQQERIGQQFMSPEALEALQASSTTKWRMAQQENEPEAFEAYKLFIPIREKRQSLDKQRGFHRGQMRHNQRATEDNQHMMLCRRSWMHGLEQERLLDPDKRPVIFIGMDATPFNEAIAKDIRQTLLISGVLLLLGLAGVVSLFWAQSYARSRKLLQDTRALAGEIVSTMPEGIVVCGPDGRISFINTIAERMLGLKESGSKGEKAAKLLPSGLWAMHTLIQKDLPVVEQEIELEQTDERAIPAAAAVTEIRTEDGGYVGLLFLLRDLSQIRQLQEEVLKKDKMAAIGHLAAGVAHEVRNPLSSIKGYATYFGSLFPKDSENRKAAQVMTSEVDRLNRVISELLEMTRPADIKLSPVNLTQLLDSSLRLVKQEADAAKVTITTHIDVGLDAVSVDPDRLTQALINLYVNAIQAMPQGGVLDVRAGLTSHEFVITVIDTGSGLPPDAQARIFDPYYTTKTTGTGLGLAIVQKIIEAHGGTIDIEHTGPEGTAFVLRIPLINKEGETV